MDNFVSRKRKLDYVEEWFSSQSMTIPPSMQSQLHSQFPLSYASQLQSSSLGQSSACSSSAADSKQLTFKRISSDNLNCDYAILYSKGEAQTLLSKCEEEFEYLSGELAKVFVFGKWHNIPRKQVAFGDEGLTYKYSNTVVPAKTWTPHLLKIKADIEQACGQTFNFVLINRYADGHDHMGEHKDDEEELVKGAPIASLSLGQPRDFVFRHQDAKNNTGDSVAAPPPVKIKLESGSLLVMKPPTNDFWYHSLPKRSIKSAPGVRINMTFRQMMLVKR